MRFARNERSFVRQFVLLAFGLCAGAVLAEPVNLYTAVTNAGLSLIVSATRCNTGLNNICDGVTYAELINGSTDPRERVYFDAPTATENPSVTIKIPDAFEPESRIVLRRVAIYPVTYWGNAKKRMPTEYRVTGVTDAGLVHELSHPTGLEYPGLDSNGYNGQHFDTTVAATPIDYGHRTFKIEFLNSGAWSESVTISFMEIELYVDIIPTSGVWRDLYDGVNFSQLLRQSGYAINRGTAYDYTWEQNYWSRAATAFDGLTFDVNRAVDGDVYRWLGYMGKANGSFVAIRTPENFRPDDVFVPQSCRIWCLSYNSNELARGPQEWTLYGLADDHDTNWKSATEEGTTWAAIHTQTGLSWTGVTFNQEGKNTLGFHPITGSTTGYRAFRFRPTKTAAYTPGGTGIDVGFNELEIFVTPVNKKGTLRVRTSESGYDLSEASHPDGATVKEMATVTIPEVVSSATAACRVTGYRLETYDWEAGQWVSEPFVDSRSFAYTPDPDKSQRLVWILDPSLVRIGVAYVDAGNEQPVTVEGVDASGFCAAGTVVTLTAHPNTGDLEGANGATNVYRSAFVRWEGDTNGLADVTSPVISFAVKEARTLTPVYSRDWLVYQYDKANEGGSGTEWRMTDGNFDIALQGDEIANGTIQNMSSTPWLKAGHGAIDFDTKVVHYTTGQEIAIKSIQLRTLKVGDVWRADFSRVVLPRTLESIKGGSFRDQTNIVEVVMDCPRLTVLADDAFTRCKALRKIVLKVPALEEITGKYAFFNAIADDTDANDWDLSALRNLKTTGASRFNLAELPGHGFKGTLRLPRIETVGESDFSTQSAFTNLVLGSENCKLRYVGTNAFYNCANLANLTIGCKRDLVVEPGAFGGNNATSRLRYIWFLKYVPSREAIDVLLTKNTAESWNRAVLYVSPARRREWEGLLTPLDRSTEELDKSAPASAIGAYVTAGGVRKAWFCPRPSPHDPKGTVVLFR